MRKVVVALAALSSVLFAFAPLSQSVLVAVASASKLLSLGAGVYFTSRSARSFDARTLMWSAWGLMSAWFALFFVGQGILVAYELGTGSAPVPSAGDLFFVAGYVALAVSAVQFILGYGATGFALGTWRDHAPTLVAWGALFAWVAVVALAPVARTAAPLLTRALNVGYPALDLMLLLPTFILLRMTFAFRGGRLWSVWATLLVGVVFFTVGDILFAIPAPTMAFVSALSDICYTLGYAFAAAGAGLELELLSD